MAVVQKNGKKLIGRRGMAHALLLFFCVAAVCISILGVFGFRYQKQKQYAQYAGIELSNRDEMVSAIRDGVTHHAQHIRLAFTAHVNSMDELDALMDELVEEALSETDDPTQGDYIRYQYGGYEVRYGYEKGSGLKNREYRYKVTITPDYYTYLSEEEAVTEEVERILDTFAFDADTTDYEKVRTIYQYVYDNVSYDMSHRRHPNDHSKTTAYAALFDHSAVCQGYCVLMYRLLRESGISTRIIAGTGYLDDWEEYHSWNIVEIDGKYYNLDVTWDKSLETTDYYLKSDAGFGEHRRDAIFTTEEFYDRYPMAERDWPEENR